MPKEESSSPGSIQPWAGSSFLCSGDHVLLSSSLQLGFSKALGAGLNSSPTLAETATLLNEGLNRQSNEQWSEMLIYLPFISLRDAQTSQWGGAGTWKQLFPWEANSHTWHHTSMCDLCTHSHLHGLFFLISDYTSLESICHPGN